MEPLPNQPIIDELDTVLATENGEIIASIDRKGGPTIDNVISVERKGEITVIWYRPCHPHRQKIRIMSKDVVGFSIAPRE